jgi:hypothetical protein
VLNNRNINVLIGQGAQILNRLASIETKLDSIIKQEKLMASQLDDIRAAVTEAVTVEKSAVVLLNGLSEKLIASQNDPAAIAEIAASIRAESADLAKAVVANTPASTSGGTA